MTYTEEDVQRIHEIESERLFRQCRIRQIIRRINDRDEVLTILQVLHTEDGLIAIVK